MHSFRHWFTLVPEVYFSSPLRNENNKNKSLEPGYHWLAPPKKTLLDPPLVKTELLLVIIDFPYGKYTLTMITSHIPFDLGASISTVNYAR
jgi:hypothetical protein